MEFPDYTITIVSVLCIVMIPIAGCSADREEERRTTTIETPGTTTVPEETETTEQQTTTTERRTTTVDYTRGLPYELRIANYREERVEVSIRIEADNGTAIYNDTVTISSNTTKEYNVTFPETGSYEIIANTTTNAESSQWRVVSKDPDEAASVVLAKDGEMHVSVQTI